jgi:hypothetical protein
MKEQIYAFVKEGKRFVWVVPRLWSLARDLPVFEYEISEFPSFDMDVWYCGVQVPTVRSVYEHALRIQAADLSYPILLNAENFILDGVHRVLKAKSQERTTLPAVRFDPMPEPDHVEDWPSR